MKIRKKYRINITALYKSKFQEKFSEKTILLLLEAWKRSIETRNKDSQIRFIMGEDE